MGYDPRVVGHRALVRDGYLRNSVSVTRGSPTVLLRHSFWELDLPANWIDSVKGLSDLLDRRVTTAAVDSSTREAASLLVLLEGQGCLSFPEDQDVYTLRQVRDLFSDLSATWYATYYAHPVWNRLRTGSMSQGGLLAWLLYNYHLSRSAAMSASRAVTHLSRRSFRGVFAESALEEFSHCEDHFFVQHPNLPIDVAGSKQVLRSTASRGFDDQMLRMAEEDWLGHVLVGLLQESTARFYDDCRGFYGDVAAAYDLSGFFRNWERHVEIDLNEGHADDFAQVLDSSETRSRGEVVYSLTNAWLTFQCLLAGLDEILEAGDRDGYLLRLPVRDGWLRPGTTELLEPYRDTLPAQGEEVRASTAGELFAELARLGLIRGRAPVNGTPAADELAFLRQDVTRSIFRALSHATEHDEIIALGRLAEGAMAQSSDRDEDPLDAATPPSSYPALALSNFLRENATRPVSFAYLLQHALALEASDAGDADGWLPVAPAAEATLASFLESSPVDAMTRDRLINLTLAMNEFHSRWVSSAGTTRAIDFFRD